jgi:phosphoglucosamine mutase
MRKLFGTDGIRGKANIYPMVTEIALSLGKAISLIFRNSGKQKILIGKDTRLSGYMIESALVSGICSMGGDAYIVGPLPTPGIAFLTGNMRVDAGVVISASHNPYEDNGIKIFSSDGYKLPDRKEEEIENFIFQNNFDEYLPASDEIGRAYRIDDAIGRYVVYLKTTFPKDLDLKSLKIVLDCANGATYKVAPEVFYELGADIITIGTNPDGKNINKECGSTNTRKLRATVISKGADLGIAFDGDGDRVIVVDENGEEIDGDYIIGICAKFLKENNQLTNNGVVITPMSNIGFEKFLKKNKINIVKSGIGDRYVVEEMLKGNYILGGEPSGHIIFRDYNTTGDGILTALQLLKVMLTYNKNASDIKKLFLKYPQILRNVPVKDKIPLKNIPGFENKVKEFKKTLNDNGRILIRYSGTEKKLRIMLEGEDNGLIKNMADELEGMVTDYFEKNY